MNYNLKASVQTNLKMFLRRIFISGLYLNKKSLTYSRITQTRLFCSQQNESKEKDHKEFVQRALIVKGSFENASNKDKCTYLEMVNIFVNKDKHRRNHVEFIYAALKNMEDFGVHKDLEVYKTLTNVMPKGKFIPQNMFQVEFMHYPKQQQCIIDLLEKMEDNGEFVKKFRRTIS